MRSELSLRAASAAVIALSSLLSFKSHAAGAAAYPVSASTSGTAKDDDKDKSKDTPAPKKEDAPKGSDASLANWLAQAAVMRMGAELGSRLSGKCPDDCYLGNWQSFNAAKDAGILLDGALNDVDERIRTGVRETSQIDTSKCRLTKAPAPDRHVAAVSATVGTTVAAVAGGVTIPWLTAIKTATGLVKDIVQQFASQVTMGATSGSALTVDDIVAATMVAHPDFITADTLRGGAFLANRLAALDSSLLKFDEAIADKQSKLFGADAFGCAVEKQALADAEKVAKDARSTLQSLFKGGAGGTDGAATSGLSSGELALGAFRLSQLKNIKFVDVTLGSSGVSKGEYKPWYAGARMLMQASVQVRYQVILPPAKRTTAGGVAKGPTPPVRSDFASVTHSGLIAVICQSVAPVKDAVFYAKDFSGEAFPSSGRKTNCAAVPASSSDATAYPKIEQPQKSP